MLNVKRLLFYASAAIFIVTGLFARNPVLCFTILVALLVLTGQAAWWKVLLLLTAAIVALHRNLLQYGNFDSLIYIAIAIPVAFKMLLRGLK